MSEPTEQDRQNKERRRLIAARQQAEFDQATCLASTLRVGFKSSMKLSLCSDEDVFGGMLDNKVRTWSWLDQHYLLHKESQRIICFTVFWKTASRFRGFPVPLTRWFGPMRQTSPSAR